MAGPFCQACGQRHDPHPHSLRHFLGEVFEGLSHADSRFWRTLWLLLSRPGLLTQEFFAGRRERYLPPFRLYLVISVVLFVLVPLLPSGTVMDLEVKAPERQQACLQLDEKLTPDEQEIAGRIVRAMEAACVDLTSNHGKRVGEAFLHNVPRMMFVLLPLVALFAALLYWRPRRYYVEHLLLQVHNHACLFMVLSLVAVLNLVPALGPIANWLLLPYLLWYVYSAQRRYYGQGRSRTLAKLLVLGLCYGLLGTMLLATTGVISALQL